MSISNIVILTSNYQRAGDPLLEQRASQKQDRTTPIQLPYHHRGSVWDYAQGFDFIEWRSVVGLRCPICGRYWCWREISPYERTVIELFPSFRREMIPVARFQCTRTGKTFSLLPYQLAPYHLYTIESMVRLLMAVAESKRKSKRGVASTVIDEAHESDVSPWLIACWIRSFVVGLGRARHELRGRYAMDDLATDGGLAEVAEHLEALSRDPPQIVSMWCWKKIGMPLMGTPSQHRCAS